MIHQRSITDNKHYLHIYNTIFNLYDTVTLTVLNITSECLQIATYVTPCNNITRSGISCNFSRLKYYLNLTNKGYWIYCYLVKYFVSLSLFYSLDLLPAPLLQDAQQWVYIRRPSSWWNLHSDFKFWRLPDLCINVISRIYA